MNLRPAAIALGLAVLPAASNAAVLTTSFADWSANAGSFTNTSSTGLGLFSNTTSVPLADGSTLGTSNVVTILQPFAGWGAWSGGYTGDIVNTTDASFNAYTTLTLTFSNHLQALGFELSPDGPLQGTHPESFTVTLSDGTSQLVSLPTYNSETNPTQFVGFFDGNGVTSVTITVNTAPDFSFGNIDSAVPEPASLALFGTGFAALGLIRRRRRV
jgi:PEP-CTERM motif